MELPSMLQELKSFGVDGEYKRIVIQGTKTWVIYDYDRFGNVRFLKTGRGYWDLYFFVDHPLGSTTKEKQGQD